MGEPVPGSRGAGGIADTSSDVRPELKSILRLEVPIIVQIGRRDMSVENVVALIPGSIIELPKSADEELELLVNNKPIGAGIAVKVGENFGIKISYIGDVRARIAALGAGGDEGAPPAAEPAPEAPASVESQPAASNAAA